MYIMANDPYTKRLLWFVFAGSRGGLNRLRIISAIQEMPMNTNKLAEKLGLDYKAIQHHLRVLEKNNLVSKQGEKYGMLYFVSPLLENNLGSLNEISAKLEKSK